MGYPLRIGPQALEESIIGPREVHKQASDFHSLRIDLLSLLTELENLEPMYRGQLVRGQLGRNSPLIRFLAKDLKGHPLVVITKLLPTDYTWGGEQLSRCLWTSLSTINF